MTDAAFLHSLIQRGRSAAPWQFLTTACSEADLPKVRDESLLRRLFHSAWEIGRPRSPP